MTTHAMTPAQKARATKATKRLRRLGPMMSTEKKDWNTPRPLFEALNRRYRALSRAGYTLDVAATAKNALCKKFFTKADDSLHVVDWHTNAAFLNMPYGRGTDGTGAWIDRARTQVLLGHVRSYLTMLIPARTDTAAWHDCVMAPLGGPPLTGPTANLTMDWELQPGRPVRVLTIYGRDGRTEIILLRGRLVFGTGRGGKAKAGAPFPSAVVTFIRTGQA